MRVLLLYNPIAGTGRSAEAAEMLRTELSRTGHDPEMAPTRPEPAHQWLDTQLQDKELLVIIGGDGAIRQCLEPASRNGVPIYQFPFGTENLFAREFGMDQTSARLIQSIEQRDIRVVDLAKANDRWFCLMASIGLDAEVVHHLASIRRGAISHRSYLAPTLTQFMRYYARPLEVYVDGERVNDDRTCFVVVGNCKQYGWRLNPAYLADMSDGLLDVAIFPTRSRVGLLRWAVRSRLGRLNRARSLIYTRGARVEVRASEPFRYQLDGDPPGPADADVPVADDALSDVLRIEIVTRGLRVLIPPQETAA